LKKEKEDENEILFSKISFKKRSCCSSSLQVNLPGSGDQELFLRK
jgi:hypothetical protein